MTEEELIRQIIRTDDSIKPTRVFDYEFVPDPHHGAFQTDPPALLCHTTPERPDVLFLILSRKPPDPTLPSSLPQSCPSSIEVNVFSKQNLLNYFRKTLLAYDSALPEEVVEKLEFLVKRHENTK